LHNYSQKHILSFIAQLLHPNNHIEISSFPNSQKFWNDVLKIGSSHLVLPAIYGAIRKKNIEHYAPQDLLLYLKEIYYLNYNQNIEILRQITFLSKVFKKNKIEYVFLKGSAILIEKPYDAIHERMLGDIDILVAEKDIIRALEVLIKNGFKENNNEFSFVKNIIDYRHLKRIVHSNYIAAVEIHSQLLDNTNKHLIKPKDLLNSKVQSSDGSWIPSGFHLWLHAILNWQYNDKGLLYNEFSLKTFYDVIHLDSVNYKSNLFINKSVTHFYSLSSILIDLYQNNNYLSSKIFEYKMLYPKFRYLINSLIKFIISFLIIFSRLKYILKYKNYRNRIFNKPKLFMKRIFIFFNKRYF
tara:strand:+ start:4258 stop:5322 length:1065 start_codon:yes stop_codon:yes gene_type:complete